jgi:hypothetical protein
VVASRDPLAGGAELAPGALRTGLLS